MFFFGIDRGPKLKLICVGISIKTFLLPFVNINMRPPDTLFQDSFAISL